MRVHSFKHQRCAMRMKITKPKECENITVVVDHASSFVSFSGGSRRAKPPGKLTKISKPRECEQITLHGARRRVLARCTSFILTFTDHGHISCMVHDNQNSAFTMHDSSKIADKRCTMKPPSPQRLNFVPSSEFNYCAYRTECLS